MTKLFVLLSAFLSVSAHAEDITGPARVVDGDTIKRSGWGVG